jgi:hypothetical protein
VTKGLDPISAQQAVKDVKRAWEILQYLVYRRDRFANLINSDDLKKIQQRLRRRHEPVQIRSDNLKSETAYVEYRDGLLVLNNRYRLGFIDEVGNFVRHKHHDMKRARDIVQALLFSVGIQQPTIANDLVKAYLADDEYKRSIKQEKEHQNRTGPQWRVQYDGPCPTDRNACFAYDAAPSKF